MHIINGQELSKQIKTSFLGEVMAKRPSLAVIIVGENSASKVYVRNKEKACNECNFKSSIYALKEETSELEVLKLIESLNENDDIDGILVQLPLPKHINEENIFSAIAPEKDVDCFNPINVGKFYLNKDRFTIPCTANGCIKLIKTVTEDLTGKNAVVIGRSNIVGKPTAQLLLEENCSVTILHSKSKDIDNLISLADIVVVAVGKPRFLKAKNIKDGSIIIDVGINRLEDGSLCGDVDFEEFKNKNCYITPVPKGVGPMTVACLLENTLKCAKRRKNV